MTVLVVEKVSLTFRNCFDKYFILNVVEQLHFDQIGQQVISSFQTGVSSSANAPAGRPASPILKLAAS